MKNSLFSFLFVAFCFLLPLRHLFAQQSQHCTALNTDDRYIGRTFFNNGSASNKVNTKISLSATIGQTVTGNFFGSGVRGGYGFWAGFTLPPKPPVVVASQGDLEDRVQISWTPDPLSPSASSYKVYRDNFLLTTLDGETFSFIDFNVIAGKFYTYSVSGVNASGQGNKASALGHLNPNGVITGKIRQSGTGSSRHPLPNPGFLDSLHRR